MEKWEGMAFETVRKQAVKNKTDVFSSGSEEQDVSKDVYKGTKHRNWGKGQNHGEGS